VVINNPAVNPTTGLVELPERVNDPTGQIQVGCAATQGNSFTVTGRGGLPENPTHELEERTIWKDLQDFSQLPQTPGNISYVMGEVFLATKTPIQIEATNWRINGDGNVELVAISSRAIDSRVAAVCHK